MTSRNSLARLVSELINNQNSSDGKPIRNISSQDGRTKNKKGRPSFKDLPIALYKEFLALAVFNNISDSSPDLTRERVIELTVKDLQNRLSGLGATQIKKALRKWQPEEKRRNNHEVMFPTLTSLKLPLEFTLIYSKDSPFWRDDDSELASFLVDGDWQCYPPSMAGKEVHLIKMQVTKCPPRRKRGNQIGRSKKICSNL